MALVIEIKVVPSSGQRKCVLDKTNILKCYIKSPPERGLANKELIKFLADSLKLPQAAIMLIAGDTARKKRIKINAAITIEQLFVCLDVQRNGEQLSLFKKE